MGQVHHYLQIIFVISFLISFSQISDSFAHEDDGEKQRDDRVHMTITNDSPNRRTGVTFYYTAITHAGHDHPWIGDSGVKICELGSMNPGQSKTCHGPFHSAKSPDQKPECNPASDWSFSFLISYNEGGNQKSMPLQRGSITSTTGDNGESRSFNWDSHTDQVFLDVDCPQPEPEVPPPVVAPDPPDPPTISVNDPEGDNPTLSGTGDAGTEVRIFISEIGFFGFNFFWFDEVVVDKDGNWTVKLKGPLDNGVYDVTIVSVDKETGLISDPANNIFVVDRNPPAKPDNTCGVGIPEPKKDEVVTVPFVPLPRINGTTDLDPDLDRDDKGGFDCALIAVTNNLNYFVNRHNIPRGTDPGQLPSDDSKIIEELRIDMNWQARGVVDADFLTGKNTFVNRYNLPITTTFIQFPTPEQIEEALNQGRAIELNFQFKKGKITLGHTVTVVGITRTSEGTTIQIHDPMTKGGKTQDSYELRLAQDRSGNSFWLLMDYPNWDGYTILEGMFIQEYATSSDSSNISVPDSDTSRGTILDPNLALIPPWIKQNADWWAQGQISDRDFAAGLGFMVKERLIQVDNVDFDPNGAIEISNNLELPDWIKQNARWWADGAINDDDFKSGIQYMIKEDVISFKEKPVTRSEDFFGIEGHIGKETDSAKIYLEQTRQKHNLPFDVKTVAELVQFESNILIANNYALEQFLEIQNFLGSSLDDSSQDAWRQYSENKNTDYMNQAIELEQKLLEIKSDSLHTVKALSDSQESTEVFFEFAKDRGFDPFVLKTNTEQELPISDSPSKIRTTSDLQIAEKYVKSFDGFIQNNIARSDLLIETTYSKEFGTSDVEDAVSRSGGIDSRSGATVCEDDNVCDSDKGEVCSPRIGETEGKCIPTWFGIKQEKVIDTRTVEEREEALRYWFSVQRFIDQGKLSPISPESSEPESSEPESSESVTHQVSVLMISGGYFPVAQFSTWQWEGECDNASHYHSDSGHAISTTLQTMGDPDPNECGYGKISQLLTSIVSMSDADVQGFIELTNIDPRNNEAMFGGSGP